MWTKPTRPIKIRSTFTALLLTGACLLRLELLVSRVERTAGTAIRGRECPVFLEFISSAKDVMRWDHTSILLLSFRVCPQWGFGGRRTGTPAQPVVCHGRIQQRPVWARGRCRISPPRFLAECCNRQLNQVVLFCCILGCLLSLICIEFVYLYSPVLFCLSVSVKWLAVKTPPKWPILCRVER